ncbi:anti-sigma factor [Actinokineospora sp. 24-640]
MHEGDLDQAGPSREPLLDPAVERLLAAEPTWAQAPPGLWASVEAVIRAESAVPSLTERRSGERGSGERRTGRRGTVGRRAAWAVGLAAAAAAVGIGGYAAGGGFTAGPEPDGVFALSATDNAPGAGAEGTLRRTPSGLEIVLDVRGLPPAPEGAYYQAWLKGDDGSVTIGTFHARRGGDDVVLWSGVEDVDRYGSVTVTLQKEGEGHSSSGVVVLVGVVAP